MKADDKKKENEAPQAAIELDDDDLENVAGGANMGRCTMRESNPRAKVQSQRRDA